MLGKPQINCRSSKVSALLFSFVLALAISLPAVAQSGQQEPPPSAGGPQSDVGPIIVPKKKEEPPPPPQPKRAPDVAADYSLAVNVPLVNVDVLVTTNKGQAIPGLKKENFRILEDGVPQTITAFNQTEAPITAVLLLEFAATNYNFMYDMFNGAYSFAQTLRPQDWVAVMSFDMRTHIVTDFTQDKRQVMGAINSLTIPGFSETNVHDAVIETLDRLDRVEGQRKYVILIATGRDTFSRHTFDEALKKVRSTPNITIFTIATGRSFLEWIDTHYGSNMGVRTTLMDYLVGQNQMRAFADITGGKYYEPRFTAELPEDFRDISANIRNQYSLAYHPTNAKQDGTYRKIRVELIAPDGGPLKVVDQKGKELKYKIIAREGYTARREVE